MIFAWLEIVCKLASKTRFVLAYMATRVKLSRSGGKNQEEQIGRLCPGAVLVERYYSPCAAATGRSSLRSGLIEKNLCRQGSQRKAGSPRILPSIAVPPGTRAAEMRRNARLPQIPQWAYKKVRNGIRRA